LGSQELDRSLGKKGCQMALSKSRASVVVQTAEKNRKGFFPIIYVHLFNLFLEMDGPSAEVR
jgi:hypothetical protein